MSTTIKYYCLRDDLTICLAQTNPKIMCAKIIIQKNMRYPGIEKDDSKVTLYIHEHSTIIELEVSKEDLIEIN